MKETNQGINKVTEHKLKIQLQLLTVFIETPRKPFSKNCASKKLNVHHVRKLILW